MEKVMNIKTVLAATTLFLLNPVSGYANSEFCGFFQRGLPGDGIEVVFESGSFVRPLRMNTHGETINTDVPEHTWLELRSDGSRAFTFRETIIDHTGVTMYDPSRDVFIKLDLKTGRILYWQSGGTPRLLYNMTAVNGPEPHANCLSFAVPPDLSKPWKSNLGMIDWTKGWFEGAGSDLRGSLAQGPANWNYRGKFGEGIAGAVITIEFDASGKSFSGYVDDATGQSTLIRGSRVD
ncbi:MAG: hypothetical protein AAGF54_13450 [Pseudomonadota bacterium]